MSFHPFNLPSEVYPRSSSLANSIANTKYEAGTNEHELLVPASASYSRSSPFYRLQQQPAAAEAEECYSISQDNNHELLQGSGTATVEQRYESYKSYASYPTSSSMEPTPLGPSDCLQIVPSLQWDHLQQSGSASLVSRFSALTNNNADSTTAGATSAINAPRGIFSFRPTESTMYQHDSSMDMDAAMMNHDDESFSDQEQELWQSTYVASAQTCKENASNQQANTNTNTNTMRPTPSSGAYDFDHHFPLLFNGAENDQFTTTLGTNAAAAAANRPTTLPLHSYPGTPMPVHSSISIPTTRPIIDSITTSNIHSLSGWTDDNRFRTSHVEKWQQRYQEMARFKEQFGHCLVPLEHCENEPLAHWVKRQRCQYKIKMSAAAKGKPDTSTLTDERKRLLDDLSFVWDAHKGSWQCRVAQIKAFVQENGHCRIPSRYPTNQSLAIWVKCQRRQYKLFQRGEKCNVDQERINELTKLGFVWEPRRKAASAVVTDIME